MKLYYVILTWYNNNNYQDVFEKMMVFGESMVAVLKEVDNVFENIQAITIEEVNNDGAKILYLPDDEDIIQQLRSLNCY